MSSLHDVNTGAIVWLLDVSGTCFRFYVYVFKNEYVPCDEIVENANHVDIPSRKNKYGSSFDSLYFTPFPSSKSRSLIENSVLLSIFSKFETKRRVEPSSRESKNEKRRKSAFLFSLKKFWKNVHVG